MGAANEDIVYQIPPKRARGHPKVFRISRITRNPGPVRARIRSYESSHVNAAAAPPLQKERRPTHRRI